MFFKKQDFSGYGITCKESEYLDNYMAIITLTASF